MSPVICRISRRCVYFELLINTAFEIDRIYDGEDDYQQWRLKRRIMITEHGEFVGIIF